MKRLLSLLLIPLALAHMTGVAPFYFAALQEVKSEMTLELAKEDRLSKVFISEDEFNRPDIFQTNGESEFSYRGRMYDYAKMVKRESGYVFYCIEDTKESLLKDLLQSSFEEGSRADKSNEIPFAGLLKNLSKDFTGTSDCLFFSSLLFSEVENNVIEYLLVKGYYTVFFSPPDLQVA